MAGRTNTINNDFDLINFSPSLKIDKCYILFYSRIKFTITGLMLSITYQINPFLKYSHQSVGLPLSVSPLPHFFSSFCPSQPQPVIIKFRPAPVHLMLPLSSLLSPANEPLCKDPNFLKLNFPQSYFLLLPDLLWLK